MVLAGGSAQAADFGREMVPLLDKYCGSCHGGDQKKGDLSFEAFRGADETALLKNIHVWQTVAERLEAREMPPEEKPQPTAAEVQSLMAWIDWAQSRAAADGKRDPGRVTIRRLNRAEYNNTIRDLLGVDLKPANQFPSDDVGYGFDNIGDVLSMPPLLVERYLAAADRIAEKVIVADIDPKFRGDTIEVEKLAPTPAGSAIKNGKLVMSAAGSVRAHHEFPTQAEYMFKVKAAGRGARLVLKVDGQEKKTIEVRGSSVYTTKFAVDGGRHRIELAFANPAPKRQVSIDFLRIEGPLRVKARALPDSHTRIIPRHPGAETYRDDAREFLATLATRAYRRPVARPELDRLVTFVEQAVEEGDTFERGMQVALRAILVSPHFVFRVELDPGDPAGEAHPINDWELASRLSYFLWSGMPDDELFRQAADGSLHQPEVLGAQVKRMLQDRKAHALVENFATQWLQVRNLSSIRPSRRRFPGFDDNLRASMMKETELFFEAVMREDLPLGTFLEADFTYLNERLARHYGIDGVEGSEFRRVSTAGTPRGGVLTQASVLTVTSNPTRTSPVKRGKWVLEQLFGTPPPPPPPGVPDLIEDTKKKQLAGTMRQQLEQHRADPNCAVCHRKMDPLGFGLENFDAVGGWRTEEDESGTPVDSSGVLPNGQSFRGPTELKAVLKTKEAAFRRSFAQKMLTYATGRGTEPFDRAAIDDIADRTLEAGDSFSSLVLAIVTSDPFLKRRGEVTP